MADGKTAYVRLRKEDTAGRDLVEVQEMMIAIGREE